MGGEGRCEENPDSGGKARNLASCLLGILILPKGPRTDGRKFVDERERKQEEMRLRRNSQ